MTKIPSVEQEQADENTQMTAMVADIVDLFAEKNDVVAMGAILEIASQYGIKH